MSQFQRLRYSQNVYIEHFSQVAFAFLGLLLGLYFLAEVQDESSTIKIRNTSRNLQKPCLANWRKGFIRVLKYK